MAACFWSGAMHKTTPVSPGTRSCLHKTRDVCGECGHRAGFSATSPDHCDQFFDAFAGFVRASGQCGEGRALIVA